MRRAMPGHPVIHSHNWELQSLVLLGQYADIIYGMTPDAPPLIVHDVVYGDDAGDSIFPTERVTHLGAQEVRKVQAGSCHHMEVAVPHETLVGERGTVVTYVMMGPRAAAGTMLAKGEPFAVAAFRRLALDDSECEYAQQVLRRLLDQPGSQAW